MGEPGLIYCANGYCIAISTKDSEGPHARIMQSKCQTFVLTTIIALMRQLPQLILPVRRASSSLRGGRKLIRE